MTAGPRDHPAPAFDGWPPEFRRFFLGLAADNSRTFLRAHDELYQRAVRRPTETLRADLERQFGRGRTFRLQRDLRFDPGGPPYRLNVALEFAATGTHHYLSASADELVASVGIARGDRDWVDRFRQAVAGPAGAELERTLGSLAGRGFEICSPELRRTPRGYPADHPRRALLRHRSMTATRRWPVSAWLGRPEARDLVLTSWNDAGDLARWLQQHAPAPTGVRT